jgi:hypothetical protein
MSTKYKVLWDNGASACGSFPWLFDTWEEADAFGRNWAAEADAECPPPEGEDSASWDVEKVETPQ